MGDLRAGNAHARPALAQVKINPWRPAGTFISWLRDGVSEAPFHLWGHQDLLHGRSGQTNSLRPGQVEKVPESAEQPDALLVLAESKLVDLTI
jgi:hypothetical protein